jgi:exopolyphosphatase / guanosine-5'-triphosphate,3'-diphosphate pyrophosphatase
MDKIAVIDLGTNTCNLLIAEYQKTSYRILYQGKEVVKLGKEGLHKNLLTREGLNRAILALQKHRQHINRSGATEIQAIATSAVREAGNKEWFQQQIKNETGIELRIIPGEKEADFIFKGVRLAFGQIDDHSLILDIGGGSNEFILTENNQPVWKQSFPIGMARVIEQVPLSDPITAKETEQIYEWFTTRLEPLLNRMKNETVSQLIGCSGAFDTLVDLIDQTDPGTKTRKSQEITLTDFTNVYKRLIGSTTEERKKMKGLESIRIEMIVPSVIFINLVISKLNIKKIYQTDYALREGVLFERIFS